MNHDNPVIKKLIALKPKFSDMNIKRLRVFGSYARGEETPDSDLDLLVDFTQKPDLWSFAGYKNLFEDHLGVSVDLLTDKFFKHDSIRNKILSEARDVW